LGNSMAVNSDVWLVSNGNAAGTGSNGAVYRISVTRATSYYSYTDHTWSTDLLATGGPTFGAGLGINPDLFVIGDPGTRQVSAIGNDQQLEQVPVQSDGTGSVTIFVTMVHGSAPPTVHEDPTCAAVPGSIFQAPGTTGPCIHVTPNAMIVGGGK